MCACPFFRSTHRRTDLVRSVKTPHPRDAGTFDHLRPLRVTWVRATTRITEDVIGQIQYEFVDWRERRPAERRC